MSKIDLFIETAFLATREKLPSKSLLCNRVESNDTSGDFLFYLVEINASKYEHLVKKIAQIISNSAKTTIGLSPESFENTLTLINDTLRRLAETQDHNWIGNFNAIIGLVQEKKVYLSQAGSLVGYIFRKNKISSLTDTSEAEELSQPSRTFAEIVTGGISIDDQLIFGTNELFNHVSLDRLRGVAKENNVRAGVYDLKQHLRRIKIYDANAVLIGALPQERENDLEEMLYLDEAEETPLRTLAKETMPLLKNFSQKTRNASIKLWKSSQEGMKKGRDTWQKSYAPKTKKALQTGNEKLKVILETGQNKISEIEKKRKVGSGIKINTNEYRKPKQSHSQALAFLTILWQKILSFFSSANRKMILAIIVILVLTIGYIQIKHNDTNKDEVAERLEVAASYDKAQTAFNSAKEDLLLGKTTDLTPLYSALDLAVRSKEDQANVEKADKLISQINEIIDDKTGTVRYKNAEGFSIAPNAKNIALVGTSLYGITPEGKLYAADTRDRKPALIGSIGQDDGLATSMYYSQSKNSILIQTDKKSLLSFEISSETIGKLNNGDPDNTWQGSSGLATYAGNIYTLDNESGNVWKYVARDIDYSKSSTYANTKSISLKDSVGLSIDGSIYVLQKDGSVAKFVRGAHEPDFSLKGIPAPRDKITEPAQIFTNEDTNSIFILDKSSNRIIKFDKAGDFANQYVFDNIKIESFVVNAKLQKMWVLSEGKVYEGNL